MLRCTFTAGLLKQNERTILLKIRYPQKEPVERSLLIFVNTAEEMESTQRFVSNILILLLIMCILCIFASSNLS